jgi:NAD+ synthase (glutamine-hydrolysing)
VCTAPARVQADERDLMAYDLLDTIERAAIRDKHPLREIFPQYEPSFHLDDECLDPKYRFQFLWGGFEREFEELRDALGLE